MIKDFILILLMLFASSLIGAPASLAQGIERTDVSKVADDETMVIEDVSAYFNDVNDEYLVEDPSMPGRYLIVSDVEEYRESELVAYPASQLAAHSEGLTIEGAVLSYPSRINTVTGEQARITYVLSKAGAVDLRILDSLGRQVWRQSLKAGDQGAQPGYNEVRWGGETYYGKLALQDEYLICILEQKSQKILGKGKVMVLNSSS